MIALFFLSGSIIFLFFVWIALQGIQQWQNYVDLRCVSRKMRGTDWPGVYAGRVSQEAHEELTWTWFLPHHGALHIDRMQRSVRGAVIATIKNRIRMRKQKRIDDANRNVQAWLYE